MIKKIVLGTLLILTNFAFAQTAHITAADSVRVPDYATISKRLDLKDAVINADQKPEFPGGTKAFGKKYFETIETLDLKNNEKLDVRLYFVVEKTGYVRSIAAEGSNKKHNELAETAVKQITTRWKPATVNGKPVRYLMYFPLVTKKY